MPKIFNEIKNRSCVYEFVLKNLLQNFKRNFIKSAIKKIEMIVAI